MIRGYTSNIYGNTKHALNKMRVEITKKYVEFCAVSIALIMGIRYKGERFLWKRYRTPSPLVSDEGSFVAYCE